MLVDFHSLFEKYSPDVYRFALYLSGDPSLAEEITQETFVRAWVLPGEISGGTVKAYLLTIARNLYRAEKKRTARHTALDGTAPDGRPGPDALVQARQDLDSALRALQTLPEVDRAALLMHAQDGLPYAPCLALTYPSCSQVRVHRGG